MSMLCFGIHFLIGMKYPQQIITTEETEAASLLPMEKEVVDYCERSIELRKKCTGDENKVGI